MARKKKYSLFLMIVIAILTLVCLGYIRNSGYENFTNVKEKFELMKQGNNCGTCTVS